MTNSDTKSKYLSHNNLANKTWDIAIIGTGMGGATIGYELSRKGYQVIFLEKGLADFSNLDGGMQLDNEDPAARLQSGNWPAKITGNIDGRLTQFFAPLGCGAGGTTLLYAAAMERFEQCDFKPSTEPGYTTAGWPFSYEQLRPYYQKAENLYKVRGTWDPLCPSEESQFLPPPVLSKCDEHFFNSFKDNGLHPYRLHIAYGYEPGCKECGGYICAKNCKSDAKTICLDPALKSGQAHIIERCEVESLEADACTVKEIICRCDGEKFPIRARIVILAAGAYFTPVLLLKSANYYWPRGLANNSDMVGRTLMFHVSDMIAVWPRGKFSAHGARKTLAFRDFYTYRNIRLGSVQSTGLSAGYGNIVYFLKTAFDQSRWSWLKPLRPLLRIPAYIGSKIFGNATIFATILEDKPYPENRIVLDPNEPSGMRFNYVIHTELRERVSVLRNLIKTALKRHRMIILSPEANLNYGHPCGTCRIGNDPSSSVLDANNKAHDLNNLYVVDASFMPTSAGANPSLTIAANALRVAEHISCTLQANDH